jgi:hypothetical protein
VLRIHSDNAPSRSTSINSPFVHPKVVIAIEKNPLLGLRWLCLRSHVIGPKKFGETSTT